MYSEVVDDPKVQMLPLILFRAWVNCMCLASKNNGVLPEMKAIAYSLRVTEVRAKAITDELKDAELLDESDGVLSPHNWNGRQFNVTGSAERMRRHRLRHSDGNSDVTSLRYTETDTEQRQNPPVVPRGSDAIATGASEFERFWKAYPKKVGKGEAQKAWKKNGHPGVERIEAVLARARATTKWLEENGRFIPNPATWLNQKRWDDEYITIEDERDAAEAKRLAIYGGAS
jgi:hypothetical protein